MSTYPGGWFGESWGAPVCEPERHRQTPVGAECTDCGEDIEARDQGLLIPYAGHPSSLNAFHLTCFLSTILPRRNL